MEHHMDLWKYIREELLSCTNLSRETWISWIILILGGILTGYILRKRTFRKWIMQHLMGCAVAIFISGVLLYIVGFNSEGTEKNPLALLLRSMTASMEMFVSESELLEVQEPIKHHPYYMIAFSLVHFLAICISAAFIIHIMGIRFRSYVNMRFARKNKKDLYVFFDLSQESINLAKDIYEVKKREKNYQIVFVKTPTEESHLERFSFSHILNFADNRNEKIEELNAINAFLTYSRRSVTMGMDAREWKETVGLDCLSRYLTQSSGPKYFFCLSINEENNINTAVVLRDRYPEGKIFCRANRNSITESFASFQLDFIDSARLAVLELKKNVAYQPVSFVKPDTKTGVATKPFKALIVGFGETGFEVFRFLYEFSAFIGKEGTENPFSYDIIDPHAEQLENRLYLHCPAVEEHKDETHRITFLSGTVESNRQKVEQLIRDTDYIAVCTDNEKENLSLGITLLNLAYKYRKPSDKLGIFIGINDNREYTKAQEIARFYNECGRKDKEGSLYEFTIVPFGAKKKLFTYKNIIDEEVVEKAKSFFFEYQKTAGLLDATYLSACAETKNEEWNNRRKEKAPVGAMGLYNKNELVQKETQDMANVWHIQTKLRLAGACNQHAENGESEYPPETRRQELFNCLDTVMQKLIARIEKARTQNESFTESYSFILNQIKEYERTHHIPAHEYETLFENLAKCEHLRWNASNRMLGYRTYLNTKVNKKHYLQKTHACMVSPEKLIENEALKDTIKYDYNTLWVGMRM